MQNQEPRGSEGRNGAIRRRLTTLLLFVTAVSLPLMAFAMNQSFFPEERTVEISAEEYERVDQYSQLNLMVNVIDNLYYEEPDLDAMIDYATHATLFAAKDPQTRYVSEEERTLIDVGMKKEAGLGLVIGWENENYLLRVRYVLPDSPADKAGIQAGDYLAGIDGQYYTAYELDLATALLRGDAGSETLLTVYRDDSSLTYDEAYREIAVAREVLGQAPSVLYRVIEGDVGCIVLLDIRESTAKEIQDALAEMKENGMQRLLLDLREANGGTFAQLMEIAPQLMPAGRIASTVTQEEEDAVVYETTEGMEDVPAFVLVSKYTAGVSEALASALQSAGATVYGQQTMGAVGDVTYFSLGDKGAGVYITTTVYQDAQGKALYQVGMTPDVILPSTSVTWLTSGLDAQKDESLLAVIQDRVQDLEVQADEVNNEE